MAKMHLELKCKTTTPNCSTDTPDTNCRGLAMISMQSKIMVVLSQIGILHYHQLLHMVSH